MHETERPQRVGWVDTARGIAIVLVVLYHAALFMDAVGSGGAWLSFMKVLETFRMPLFFFAAGIFSAKILGQSFAQLWQRRIALFLYLYVLWSAIRFVYFQMIPWTLDGPSAADWREFVVFAILPAGGLWFLYALALFSLFVWIFRKVWWWIPVGISLAVSIAFGSGLVPVDNVAWLKIGTYMVFFVGSVYLKDITLAVADRVRPWMAVVAALVYGAAATAFWVVDELRDIPGLRLVVSILGVAAGVAVSVTISSWRMSGTVQHLGQNTLPIYLVHYFPIATFAAVVGVMDPTTFTGLAGFLVVPALTGGAILISLLVAYLLRDVHGVFDLPRLARRESRTKATVDAS